MTSWITVYHPLSSLFSSRLFSFRVPVISEHISSSAAAFSDPISTSSANPISITSLSQHISLPFSSSLSSSHSYSPHFSFLDFSHNFLPASLGQLTFDLNEMADKWAHMGTAGIIKLVSLLVVFILFIVGLCFLGKLRRIGNGLQCALLAPIAWFLKNILEWILSFLPVITLADLQIPESVFWWSRVVAIGLAGAAIALIVVGFIAHARASRR